MNLVLGFKQSHPYVFYDALRSTAQPITVEKKPSCVCCGAGSTARLGDLEPLPAKDTYGDSVPSSR